SQEEIFSWEVEQAVRRIADAGPIDLSHHDLYTPIAGYLTSRFRLEFPDGWSSDQAVAFTQLVKERAQCLGLTELVRMVHRNEDDIFHFIKDVPPPRHTERTEELRALTKGDWDKAHMIEYRTVFNRYIRPAMERLPPAIANKLAAYFGDVLKNDCGAFTT